MDVNAIRRRAEELFYDPSLPRVSELESADIEFGVLVPVAEVVDERCSAAWEIAVMIRRIATVIQGEIDSNQLPK